MRIALIGPPNSGKSTLFNQVAGYKAETGNFHGTTVTYLESRLRLGGKVVEIVDLPGVYTLEAGSPAEQEVKRYLASHSVDVILNILDTTRLTSGLELTLELLPLGLPMVVVLNMMDEAAAQGLEIDLLALSRLLGVPVLPLVASKGRGVREVFLTAFQVAQLRQVPQPVLPFAAPAPAISVTTSVSAPSPLVWEDSLEQRFRQARTIVSQVLRQGERRITLRDRLDNLLLHPFYGYLFLFLILAAFFQVTYATGKLFEGPLLAFFESLSLWLRAWIGEAGLLFPLIDSLVQGIAAGAAIVLPYLVPFLIGLSLLEDIGYLPRVAFLMDGLMRRIGLHGKALISFILGYGCNVPAVMATRVLENERDRLVAAALAVLVPCAARTTLIFGLVAFYLGPLAALGLYLLNLLIIALTGRLLLHLLPEATPGLILEMPPFRIPTLRVIRQKVWFRVKEFIVEAWPLLIVGSLVLSLLQIFGIERNLNLLLRPLTWSLGLPQATGVPLIFGVLRKELTLVMLGQAFGNTHFERVLSPSQMLTFTTFVMFYLPCLATLGALKRELGARRMLQISILTVLIAWIVAWGIRWMGIFLA